MPLGATIVIDVGKTLAKISLWSPEGDMLDRQVRPNQPRMADDRRHLDVEGIGAWVLETLGRYRDRGVETVIPVGHGAGFVALAGEALAYPPLDYEQPIPGEMMAAYRERRDPFARTGSPLLPGGLNLGAQLFWMDHLYPEARDAVLLLWAQYWAWLLTGRAVSEVTSLGCHSDLWAPEGDCFSDLARSQGWAERFAPLVCASDVVGTLRPEVAARTGLSDNVQVLAGVHDSNAALLAARGFQEIDRYEATILSTGTWFIAMRLAREAVPAGSLSETRDCLVNVDAYRKPVPSARFMGGREIESVIEIDTRRVDIKPDQPALLAAVSQVLAQGTMMLPTLTPGCGPYPERIGGWLNEPEDWYQRRAAMCLYAALVAHVSLDLIGSKGLLLVEGRFAEAEVFVRALASLRPGTEVMVANAHNDVSFGALRLLDPALKPQGDLRRIEPLAEDLSAYCAKWRTATGSGA